MKKKIKKQVLRYGTWKYGDGELNVTESFVKKIVDNFNHSPYVPILRGHIDNSDAEKDPSLVLSKNIDNLEVDEQGLNAVFEVDETELEKYNDVSVGINPDYENHETGESIGPMLEHIAFVLNPYIKQLKEFTALRDRGGLNIYLSEIKTMTQKEDAAEKDVAKEEVKEEVAAETVTETKTEQKEEAKSEEETKDETQTEVTNTEEPETKSEETEKPTEVTITASDSESDRKRIMELEEQLAKKNLELAERNAEGRYTTLLNEGKVLPSQKDAFIALASQSQQKVNLSEGTKTIGELLDDLFSKAPKLIEFEEKGKDAEVGQNSFDFPSTFIEDLRKLSIHAKKTDIEFADYLEKNKDTLSEQLQKRNK